ncbi:hypothetical protein FQA39_LY16460 [Lamprigera yunnana]|nr:hypothetical protein FQA39_LY16460 [Lamprigera yunnana]
MIRYCSSSWQTSDGENELQLDEEDQQFIAQDVENGTAIVKIEDSIQKTHQSITQRVPEEPRCGFSNAVVQILRMHGVPYDSHDVLKDEGLRQKDFSNWPTIPQVFINGEFAGGCDIMLQMHQSGDLIEELQKAGIRSALLDKQSIKEETKNTT